MSPLLVGSCELYPIPPEVGASGAGYRVMGGNQKSSINFSPFSCSSSLPAGLTTLAAWPAAPAARAPEVLARLARLPPGSGVLVPSLVGLGLGFRLWPRPWPRPRPASYARVACWFPAGGCRAWPAGFSLLAGTSLSALFHRHFSPALFWL